MKCAPNQRLFRPWTKQVTYSKCKNPSVLLRLWCNKKLRHNKNESYHMMSPSYKESRIDNTCWIVLLSQEWFHNVQQKWLAIEFAIPSRPIQYCAHWSSSYVWRFIHNKKSWSRNGLVVSSTVKSTDKVIMQRRLWDTTWSFFFLLLFYFDFYNQRPLAMLVHQVSSTS